jgi:hypothetical protein
MQAEDFVIEDDSTETHAVLPLPFPAGITILY